jgi:hypothetical protein
MEKRPSVEILTSHPHEMSDCRWSNISDDSRYIRNVMDELGLTGDFADLSTEQMSDVLMLAAHAKTVEARAYSRLAIDRADVVWLSDDPG